MLEKSAFDYGRGGKWKGQCGVTAVTGGNCVWLPVTISPVLSFKRVYYHYLSCGIYEFVLVAWFSFAYRCVKAPLSLRPYGGRGYEFRSVSSWSFNAFAPHSVSSHDCLSYDGIQNIWGMWLTFFKQAYDLRSRSMPARLSADFFTLGD